MRGGWIMLQGLQMNRAQLFFNWAPYHTHTHTQLVCRSLFSNFPAVGSVELNTLVEEQPSESLHMGSVLVVWLVNPCTNQGLWQQPGHINLCAQSQHKPKRLSLCSQLGRVTYTRFFFVFPRIMWLIFKFGSACTSPWCNYSVNEWLFSLISCYYWISLVGS